ncbi:uncharacterized protein LOC111029130 [Myzus persicae]|uniref:uncharacterized protein LOC111029130 n=1 Tax=Myzus persicae TaxID=13164 RepID=UPI000B939B07|nr:uncharacterized protein LOC111029130 [Myzus persicae]
MVLCFICNNELYSGSTQVCSSMTPLSNTPFSEKFPEMLGKEYEVIVTPADQMCMKCALLLIHFDDCENKIKVYKNWIVSIQIGRRTLLPDQAIEVVEAAQETHDSVEKEVGQDNANDVEPMLATIDDDNLPTNSRDTQHNA